MNFTDTEVLKAPFKKYIWIFPPNRTDSQKPPGRKESDIDIKEPGRQADVFLVII